MERTACQGTSFKVMKKLVLNYCMYIFGVKKLVRKYGGVCIVHYHTHLLDGCTYDSTG